MRRGVLIIIFLTVLLYLNGCQTKPEVKLLYATSNQGDNYLSGTISYLDNYQDYLKSSYDLNIKEDFFTNNILYFLRAYLPFLNSNDYQVSEYYQEENSLYIICKSSFTEKQEDALTLFVFGISKELYQKVDQVIAQDEKGLVFKTEEVTISFDYGYSSSPDSDEIVVKKGTILTKPFAPFREGYLFWCWYQNEEEYDFKRAIKEDLYLVGRWLKSESGDVELLYSSSFSLQKKQITTFIFDYESYLETNYELGLEEDFFNDYLLYSYYFINNNLGTNIYRLHSYAIINNDLIIQCSTNRKIIVLPAFGPYLMVFKIKKVFYESIDNILIKGSYFDYYLK